MRWMILSLLLLAAACRPAPEQQAGEAPPPPPSGNLPSRIGQVPSVFVAGSVRGPVDNDGLRQIIFTTQVEASLAADLDQVLDALDTGHPGDEHRMYYIFTGPAPEYPMINAEAPEDFAKYRAELAKKAIAIIHFTGGKGSFEKL